MALDRDARSSRRTRRRSGGRTDEITLDALLERIHDVNPTGRVPRHGARERAGYEQKARLQSRLVESFAERVDVRAHDDMPGVVSLAVPSLERSAGHAILDELSTRARSILEEKLAESARPRPSKDRDASARRPRGEHDRRSPSNEEGAVARSVASVATPEGAVDRALRLVDEYDFECAERLLREGLVEPDSGVAKRAFEALVHLYVDHLGRDEDALGLADEAPRVAAVLSSEARRALGLAATRLGRYGLALTHLRDVPPMAATEVVTEVLLGALRASSSRPGASSWSIVRGALELLRRDAAHRATIPQGATDPVRDIEDRIRTALRDRTAKELEEDEDLAELVDLLLPEHAGRDDLRARAEADRRRARVERRLERLAAAEGVDDVDGVEAALDALEPERELLDAAQRERLDGARRSARERRARETARHVVELTQRRPSEDAALAYLHLPRSARGEARAADATGLLEIVEVLSPLSYAEHAIARAAVAFWSTRTTPEPESWERIAPHAAILSRAPELAGEVKSIRALGARPRAADTLDVSSSTRGPRIAGASVRSSSRVLLEGEIALSGIDGDARPDDLLLADGLLVVDGVEWAATVRHASARRHEVALHPVHGARSAAPRLVRVTAQEGWSAVGAVASGTTLHLVTRDGQHQAVSFEGDVLLEDRSPLRALTTLPGHAVCEGRLVALAAPALASASCVVQGAAHPTSATLREPLLEVRRGDAAQSFAIPRITPRMVIESPKGDGVVPVLLEHERERVMLWQQTATNLWRASRLHDAGTPTTARTLPSRGIFVLSRPEPPHLRIDRLILEAGCLRVGRPLVLERGLGIVVDDARRRAWTVARGESSSELVITPLGLRRALRSP